MNLLEKNNLKSISSTNFVLCNPFLEELIENNGNCKSIIYFVDSFNKDNPIVHLSNNESLYNITIVSMKKNQIKNEKLTSCSHISSRIVKSLKQNIFIIIDMNDNYEFSKFVIKNLKCLMQLSAKLKKNLYFSFNNSSVFCAIISNNSIYFNDLFNCIKALSMNNTAKQYEFIYDTVCDYLDSQFCNNNLCDFKNDQCVSNRSQCTTHSTFGCCYSFNYTGLFDFRVIKDVKLCKYMQNRTCTTKNITCKLFTCKYLKNKNIRFDTHKILLLDCFFNKKQHNVIQSNFFRTREEILQKLQERNNDLYYWYILRQKYRIKHFI